MIKLLKIPNYIKIERVLENYHTKDRLVEGKIEKNLEALFARRDLTKRKKEKMALNYGN